MKIPKTLKIFGHTWKVKSGKAPSSGGTEGSFSWANKTITLYGSQEDKEETLIHEIMELTLTHLKLRFYPQEQGMEYLFSFGHTGLCNFHIALFQILKDNKLIK